MYYNEDTIIFHNNEFVKAIEAKCNFYDQSLHYGYAVFEGIRSYDTSKGVKIFKAKEHFDRMQFSCGAVGIPYPFHNESLIQTCYELLEKNNFKNAYLRPLISCSPNMSLTKAKTSQLTIAAWEWPAYLGDQLLKLKTSTYRRISPSSFVVAAKVSGHYVNSILATQEAKDEGYDEALMLDMDGFVAEGPGANIFIQADGILHTPQPGSILPGITRATVIEICGRLGIEVKERKIRPEELHTADGAFYCGTAAEVIGIESLDGHRFPLAWNNSLGAIIKKSYKDLVIEKEIKAMAVA